MCFSVLQCIFPFRDKMSEPRSRRPPVPGRVTSTTAPSTAGSDSDVDVPLVQIEDDSVPVPTPNASEKDKDAGEFWFYLSETYLKYGMW